MDTTLHRSLDLHIRALSENARSVRVVASTDAVDAYDEIVDQKTWKLDRFKSNPVILLGHDSRSLPIGRAEEISVVDNRLEMTIVFATKEANPLAENAWQSFRQKTMRAVSVGFRPGTIKTETRGTKQVDVLRDCELLEVSCVAIGANHEALARSKARGGPSGAPAQVDDCGRALSDLIVRSYREQPETPRTRLTDFGTDGASIISCAIERGIDLEMTEAEEIDFIADRARRMAADDHRRQHPSRDTGSDALAALIDKEIALEDTIARALADRE
jgi:HK97 family phage prohead protease